MGIDSDRFISEINEELICAICRMVLENPLQIIECEHVFCSECISQWISNGNETCPVDRSNINKEKLRTSRIINKFLCELKIKCDYESEGCKDNVKLEQLEKHLNECKFNPKNKQLNIKSKFSIVKKENELLKQKNLELMNKLKMLELKENLESDKWESYELEVSDSEVYNELEEESEDESWISWKNTKNGDVNGGIIGGYDINGEQMFIGRVLHNDNYIPGKVVPSHGVCYIPYNRKEHKYSEYQLLQKPDKIYFDWGLVQFCDIPTNAYPVEKNGKIFVGRVFHENSLIIGKVESTGLLYVPFDGIELIFCNYEILTLKKDYENKNDFPNIVWKNVKNGYVKNGMIRGYGINREKIHVGRPWNKKYKIWKTAKNASARNGVIGSLDNFNNNNQFKDEKKNKDFKLTLTKTLTEQMNKKDDVKVITTFIREENYLNVNNFEKLKQINFNEKNSNQKITKTKEEKINQVKVENKLNPNFSILYNYGKTPLHSAAEKGKLDIVKYFIEQGVDIKTPDKYNMTPLHRAVQAGQLDVVKYLVEQGADIKNSDKYGWTPLHSAAKEGRLDVVKYLKERGADIKTPDNYGMIPLHRAVQSGKLDVVKYLEEQGADIQIANKCGSTPIYSTEFESEKYQPKMKKKSKPIEMLLEVESDSDESQFENELELEFQMAMVQSLNQIEDIEEENINNQDNKEGSFKCEICFDSFQKNESAVFDCMHMFCTDCAKMHLTQLINDGSIDSLKCPSPNCDALVSDELLEELVPNGIYQKFINLRFEKTLSSFEDIVFCPRPNCGLPVQCVPDDLSAECQCGFMFCTNCSMPFHGYLDCGLTEEERQNEMLAYTKNEKLKIEQIEKLKEQRKKEEIDSERLISEKCKKCPQCNANIEKNEGCNHMICTQCQVDFCWLCLTILPKLSKHSEQPHFMTGKCALFEAYYSDEE